MNRTNGSAPVYVETTSSALQAGVSLRPFRDIAGWTIGFRQGLLRCIRPSTWSTLARGKSGCSQTIVSGQVNGRIKSAVHNMLETAVQEFVRNQIHRNLLVSVEGSDTHFGKELTARERKVKTRII